MDYREELSKSLKKLSDIEFALNESSIVAITDSRGIIQFANDKFCEVSKYSLEELIGSKQSIVNSGYHSRDFFKQMWRTIGTGNVWRGEIKNKAKNGSFYWVDTTIVPFLNEKGKPYQYIAIRHDISKRKQYEETIETMAYYDPLTSLPNRNLLNKWLSEQLINQEQNITVLFLDLDRFKSINDNYGHHMGDILLIQIANRLQKCLRKSDFITRQGGDEFIIFLTEPKTKDEALSVVNKIISTVSLPYYIDNEEIFTSTSIGVSVSKIVEQQEDYTEMVEMLIRQADTAMYHAKKSGGNSYSFNTPTQNSEMLQYYQLEKEIFQAFDNKEFYIVYQPLINIENEKIAGVEALLRWKNPKLGMVPPDKFIPILEELGMIIPIGKWIIKSVAKQMKLWENEGLFIKRASINVSPIQFRNKNFVRDLNQILQEEQLAPERIELEITEGTILDINTSIKILNELKELGIKIAIDDFGTGYSSLSYLKQLSIDTLKIDKSFIHELDTNDEVIVNTIITMAKNLNFKVLAEGIENKEQLQYLRSQKCNEGQGFYWSKPVLPEELLIV